MGVHIERRLYYKDEADTHLAPLNEKLEEIRRNKYYLEYYYAYSDSLERGK